MFKPYSHSHAAKTGQIGVFGTGFVVQRNNVAYAAIL